jgi:Holliday junction resolvasome RuvABC DNA-binding subunit
MFFFIIQPSVIGANFQKKIIGKWGKISGKGDIEAVEFIKEGTLIFFMHQKEIPNPVAGLPPFEREKRYTIVSQYAFIDEGRIKVTPLPFSLGSGIVEVNIVGTMGMGLTLHEVSSQETLRFRRANIQVEREEETKATRYDVDIGKQDIKSQDVAITEVEKLPPGRPIYLRPGEKPVSSVNAFRGIYSLYPMHFTVDGEYVGIFYCAKESETGDYFAYYNWSEDGGGKWETKYLGNKIPWLIGKTVGNYTYLIYSQGGTIEEPVYKSNTIVFRIISRNGEDYNQPLHIVSPDAMNSKIPTDIIIDGKDIYLLYVNADVNSESTRLYLLKGTNWGEKWEVLWRSLSNNQLLILGTFFMVNEDIHIFYIDKGKEIIKHIVSENKGRKWYEKEPLLPNNAWIPVTSICDKDQVLMAFYNTRKDGTDKIGFLKSEDSFKSWEKMDIGIDKKGRFPLIVDKSETWFSGTWYIVCDEDELFASRNEGESWERVGFKPTSNTNQYFLVFNTLAKLEGDELHLAYSCILERERFIIYTHLSLKDFYNELEKADIKEGDVIRDMEGFIYLMEAGERRQIPDDETLKILGYKTDTTKKIDSSIVLNSFPVSKAIPALVNGSLIKVENTDKLYIIENNKKCLIPDSFTLQTLVYKGEPVEIKEQLLNKIETGEIKPKLSEDNVLKNKVSKETYILANKQKHLIPDVYTLEILGYKESDVMTKESNFLSKIATGEPLPKLQEGDWLWAGSRQGEYFILRDKKKHPIPFNYMPRELKKIESHYLDMIETGETLPKRSEGDFLKVKGSTEVYILDLMVKNLVTDAYTLEILGYDESQIETIEDDIFENIITRDPLAKLQEGDLLRSIVKEDSLPKTVYYILRDKKKHFIPTIYARPEVTRTSKSISHALLEKIPTGKPVNSQQDVAKVETQGKRQFSTYKTEPCIGVVYSHKDSRTFHCPECPEIRGTDKKDLISFSSAQDASGAGGIPCDTCKPLSEDTKRKNKKEPSTEPFDGFIEGVKEIFGGKRK